jgi:hypothetical protein
MVLESQVLERFKLSSNGCGAVIGISLISRSTSETFIHFFQVSGRQGGKNGERSERFRLRSDIKNFFLGGVSLRERYKKADSGASFA